MLWKMDFFLNETLILLIQLQSILDCDSPISGLFYSLYIVKKTLSFTSLTLCVYSLVTMSEAHLNSLCYQWREISTF